MTTAVDSNILLDVINGDESERVVAKNSLLRFLSNGDDLVCCEVVYAEVSRSFRTQSELDGFLEGFQVRYDETDRYSAFLAGRAFHSYRQAGGARLRVLPDFLIAGHAIARADRLLTRDRGFFREHFQGLTILSPA